MLTEKKKFRKDEVKFFFLQIHEFEKKNLKNTGVFFHQFHLSRSKVYYENICIKQKKRIYSFH